MIENIARYRRGGRAAARRGAERRGADRLHDRVADRLAHRGAHPAALHGRHRRTALPRVRGDAERDDSGVGGGLADADADDVPRASCSHVPTEQEGRFARWLDESFQTLIDAYGRTLTWVLQHQGATLVVFALTLVATAAAVLRRAEGLLSRPGYRRHHRRHRGAADRVVPGHVRAPAGACRRAAAGPGRREHLVVHRRGRHERDAEQRPRANQPEAAVRAPRPASSESSGACSAAWRTSPGSRSTCRRCRTSRSRTGSAARSISTASSTPTSAQLDLWGGKLLEALRHAPELQDVATDQQNGGSRADLAIDRDTASRFGITAQTVDDTLYSAFGQRQVSTIFTQMNQYHVILELQPQYRHEPGLARRHLRADA